MVSNIIFEKPNYKGNQGELNLRTILVLLGLTESDLDKLKKILNCCCCCKKPEKLNIEDCSIEIKKSLNIEDCDINI